MVTHTATVIDNQFSVVPQQSLVFRRADESDCHEISSLFQQIYGNSSHPEIQPGALAHNLVDKDNYWLTCRSGGEIIGTTACVYNAWNQSYELGRAVTTVQWRRHGIAQQLVQRCCDWLRSNRPDSVVVGYPRAKRIMEICQALDTPFTAFGHDGGVQIANDEYEYHLIIFLHNGNEPTVPCPFESVEPDLRLPELVGPQAQDYWSAHGCNAALTWNTEQQRDLFIQSVSGHISEPSELKQLVNSLRTSFTSLNSISLTVPQSRTDVLQSALLSGFRITAWLPGWFFDGTRRHHCFRLVQTLGSSEPHKHGMDVTIDSFDKYFEQWQAAAMGESV